MTKQRLIIGITGASGATYGVAALKALKAAGVETHLIVSRSGQLPISDSVGVL